MVTSLVVDLGGISKSSDDPDFAGVSQVSISVPVDPTSTPPPVAWANQSLNFWSSMPVYGKVLIILAVVLCGVCFVGCALCFVFGFEPTMFLRRPEDDKFIDTVDEDYTDPEERGRAVAPVNDSGTKGSYSTKSLSSYSRDDHLMDFENRVKTKVPSKAKSGKSGSNHPRKPASAHGRLDGGFPEKQGKSKTMKPSSMHGRIDDGHTGRQGRSNVPDRARARSLSPSRNFRPPNSSKPISKSISTLKSRSEHGSKPRPKSNNSLKARSEHIPSTKKGVRPNGPKSNNTLRAKSDHGPPIKKGNKPKSLKSSSMHKPTSSAQHSGLKSGKKPVKKSTPISNSPNIVDSFDSEEEIVSLNTGPGRKKGRKNDDMSLSSHSASSFGSFDSFASSDTGQKRGRRPAKANRSKKKGVKKISSTNDIVENLD